jgi:hypothetical protein
MNPTVVQVDTQLMCVAFSSVRKDFRQQTTHQTMGREVLAVETPPGGIALMTQNPPIPQITADITFFVPIISLALVATSSGGAPYFVEC